MVYYLQLVAAKRQTEARRRAAQPGRESKAVLCRRTAKWAHYQLQTIPPVAEAVEQLYSHAGCRMRRRRHQRRRRRWQLQRWWAYRRSRGLRCRRRRQGRWADAGAKGGVNEAHGAGFSDGDTRALGVREREPRALRKAGDQRLPQLRRGTLRRPVRRLQPHPNDFTLHLSRHKAVKNYDQERKRWNCVPRSLPLSCVNGSPQSQWPARLRERPLERWVAGGQAGCGQSCKGSLFDHAALPTWGRPRRARTTCPARRGL